MLRTTPLLIVLMLLGHSGAALACELWCFNPTTHQHHDSTGCHEASSPVSADRQLVPTTAGCDSPALAAFVSQTRQTNFRPMPVTLPSMLSVAQLPGRAMLTEGWGVFNIQPARPQTSRTILRI